MREGQRTIKDRHSLIGFESGLTRLASVFSGGTRLVLMSAFGECWLKFQLQCLARFTLC